MEHSNRQSYLVGVLLLALAVMVACTPQPAAQPKLDPQPANAAAGVPVRKQLGVIPAGPGKETPGTSSAAKSDISKAEQSNAMPMPGQANDHSTLKPVPSKRTNASAPN